MIRVLMSAAAAALLIAAPVAASAATTATKPAAHAAAKPGKRMASAKPRQASRDSGNAAVEQLNEQSLQRARGGQ